MDGWKTRRARCFREIKREREGERRVIAFRGSDREKEGRAREREREGRTACGVVVVVAFEPVRVTEWNGSSVDQRKVGTKGVATTANRARISSERGERAARGTRRRDEADGPTHVRSRGTTLRVRVHATQRCTQRGGRVIRTCVRARMHPRNVDTLTHTGGTQAYGHTHVRDDARRARTLHARTYVVRGRICVCGRKPAVRIDRALAARDSIFFLPADARER